MAATENASLSNNNADMSRAPLTDLAGPLALTAGTLFVITQLVTFATIDFSKPLESLTDPIYLANGIVYFGAFCLLMLALVAAYGWEVQKAGRLGSIGFSAAVIGTLALGANVGWFEVFVTPWLVSVAPEVLNAPKVGSLPIGGFSSYVLFAFGWILFGIASLRARVFPGLISLAIVFGAIIAFPGAVPPNGIPFGLAIASLGTWMLWSKIVPRSINEPVTI